MKNLAARTMFYLSSFLIPLSLLLVSLSIFVFLWANKMYGWAVIVVVFSSSFAYATSSAHARIR